MVRNHHVAVLPTNHVSTFYLGLYISGGSHIKYIYIIDWKYNYVVFSDHTSLSTSLGTMIADKQVSTCAKYRNFKPFVVIKMACLPRSKCMLMVWTLSVDHLISFFVMNEINDNKEPLEVYLSCVHDANRCRVSR